MKKCDTCKQEKELIEYNKNRTKKDGLNSICKICSRARSKKYYLENHDKHIKNIIRRNKEQETRIKTWVASYLRNNNCVDCNENNIVVLEFDHLKNKEFNISTMIHRRFSILRIKKEIEKCEVVCANCHRIRTAKQYNYWKLNY